MPPQSNHLPEIDPNIGPNIGAPDIGLVCLKLFWFMLLAASHPPKSQKPDIGFIPTEPDAIAALLTLANLTEKDVFYDLGCGDGRILIQAVQQFGGRGVGIDLDPARIQEARTAAHLAGVSDRLQFRQENLFESDFSDATIVFLYLLPHLNLRLRSRLTQLRPGTRIISLDFDLGDWPPDRVVQIPGEMPMTLFLWRVPIA